jgi:hypothetical protein
LHSGKHNEEVHLCAFDILVEGGDDLRKLPLHLRKTNLERLLARRPEGIFVNPFDAQAITFCCCPHGAVRSLVGPNDLSALKAKQAHGLVVDGVKYVENRQERCGASWAEHLILFSRFVARAFLWILAIHTLSPNTKRTRPARLAKLQSVQLFLFVHSELPGCMERKNKTDALACADGTE